VDTVVIVVMDSVMNSFSQLSSICESVVELMFSLLGSGHIPILYIPNIGYYVSLWSYVNNYLCWRHIM